jgi:hypothetical protein
MNKNGTTIEKIKIGCCDPTDFNIYLLDDERC